MCGVFFFFAALIKTQEQGCCSVSWPNLWQYTDHKIPQASNFTIFDGLPSTTPLINFLWPVGSTPIPDSSTDPGASAQASPETGLGLGSASTWGVSSVLSFWTILAMSLCVKLPSFGELKGTKMDLNLTMAGKFAKQNLREIKRVTVCLSSANARY